MSALRWTACILLSVSMAATASGKRATIYGTVVLSDGRPVADAEIIVKDSWAGLLVMRERVLTRVRTDAYGQFVIENVAYRHTLDLLIPGRACGWLTSNETIGPSDRDSQGIYRPCFVLLTTPCNTRGAEQVPAG